MSESPTRLADARTDREIVPALARALWWKVEREEAPDGKVPGAEDLAAWVGQGLAPPAARAEADRRATELDVVGGAELSWQFARPNEGCSGLYAEDKVAGGHSSLAELHCQFLQGAGNGELDPLAHPIAPLVLAWQQRPKDVRIDEHHHALLPLSAVAVRDTRTEEGSLFADLPGAVATQKDLFADLPAPYSGTGRVPPCAPLMLFNASHGPSSRDPVDARGRGAPLALRIWVEAVTGVRRKDRYAISRLSTRLDDLVPRLWPNGWSGPKRDGEKLRRALRQVHNSAFPWERGLWVAVRVVSFPDVRDWSSELVVDVELPGPSGVGPMVYRPTLRAYGVKSASAYRLALGLAAFWNQYLTVKGTRLNPTEVDERTGAITRSGEMGRLPDLGPVDLLDLGAPHGATSLSRQARRGALVNVKTAADKMAENDDVVLIRSAGRGIWRLEPPDWWGGPKPDGG